MYSDSDIDAAVAAGALNADAARGLRDFVAAQRATPAVDEEHFRLLTGFNDIFVSIAALLILIAVAQLGALARPAFGGVAVAAASWGMAEYFTRKRRMALPSILLLWSFVGGVFVSGVGELATISALDWEQGGWRIGGCAALAALAAFVHWRRFKVPITVAAGAMAALGTIIASLLAIMPDMRNHWLALVFVGGLSVFTLAMWWDASDRTRTTRRSDVAFWLHLMASPMIVHPVFVSLGIVGGEGAPVGRAVIAVAIYLGLALVALAVDRRALLVSALFYVLYAMTALLRAAGSLTESFALTGLVIGSGLLLLSAFWHRVRTALVGNMPQSVQAKLPEL